MSKFFAGVVNTAFFVVIGITIGSLGAAAPAAASPQCMTQDEARKAFPHDHLYWHTLKHCWDNVGQKRNATPAAKNADTAYAEATQPENEPAAPPADKPAEAAVAAPAKPIAMPAVPFTSGESRGGLFWPAPDAAANDPAPRTQEADAQLSAPAPQAPAASPPPEKVVIGAPNAAPGSPEYLLEHCCWPRQVPAAKVHSEPVGPIVVAAGGASGFAVGLWLFFRRRRQPAPRRAAPRFGRRTMRVAVEDAMAAAAGVFAMIAARATALAPRVTATAAARVTAVRASALRSWSALRDRRAY
ncbi:MAG TPA: hypothetical protein VFL51_12040 [Pseudolabrys sp.]|nr:hypothetical protein [Pseudolabrys sp.]